MKVYLYLIYNCTLYNYISSIGILSLYIHYFKVITKSYNYMTSCIGVLKYVSYFTCTMYSHILKM